jgi:hypothetical protein
MLTVSNSTLGGNSGDYGGAIFTNGDFGHATATVSNCTINGNSVQMRGGGIYCVVTDVPVHQKDRPDRKVRPVTRHSTGTLLLTIVNSTISDNVAGLTGGAIYDHALVSIANSTFSGNSAGSAVASTTMVVFRHWQLKFPTQFSMPGLPGETFSITAGQLHHCATTLAVMKAVVS